MKQSILALALLISAASHASSSRYVFLHKDSHRHTHHHGATSIAQDKFTQDLQAARNKGNKSPKSIATDLQTSPQRYIPGLAPKSPVAILNGFNKNKSCKK